MRHTIHALHERVGIKLYANWQLTAALRNLADAGDGREKFVTHKVVQGLAELMDCYPADGDLMLYVSRILRCSVHLVSSWFPVILLAGTKGYVVSGTSF